MLHNDNTLEYKISNGHIENIENSNPVFTNKYGDSPSIVVYTKPSDDVLSYLVNNMLVDEHTLNSALDSDEIARLEFEPNHIAAIIKRPEGSFKDMSWEFSVSSIGVFLFDNTLIVVQNESLPLFNTSRSAIKIDNVRGVFLSVLYHSINQFLRNIKLINRVSNSIEKNIEHSLSNKSLSNMFELQKSLVYYQSAIQSNSMLLNKLKMNSVKFGFTQEENDFLDDMTIENKQCEKLVEMYSSILTGMSDARVSIVNNNLSTLMKKLTVISLVFMPLNIIASMGGMSEYTLFTKDMPWLISYSLFTVGMIVVGYITWLFIRNIGIDEPEKRKTKKINIFKKKSN